MRTRVVVHESSWVLALLVALTCAAYANAVAPAWGWPLSGALGALTGALFLGSLWLHEAAHAFVARRRGLRVGEEHLVAFGGLVTVDHAADRRTELWTGLAGAATGAAMAALCLAAAQWLGPPLPPRPAQLVLAWLGIMNAGVTLLNLLPIFPLDGGRLLRAAGRPATGLGRVLAFALLAWGLGSAVNGGGLPAMWVAFLGWLLLEVSADGRRYLRTSV